ncbi:MAG: exodeoxyribonuclease VII small subunit [Ilumatobacteraceae bacterium]|jgi:exodeoxyribonuclease VII small subunit
MSAKKTADGAVAEGYAEALAELDEILARLDRPDVDVDVLANEVARAAALITFCRERIGSARLQIETVVAQLSDD